MKLTLIKGGKVDGRSCTCCKKNITKGNEIQCSICSKMICTGCDISRHSVVAWCKSCASECDSRRVGK